MVFRWLNHNKRLQSLEADQIKLFSLVAQIAQTNEKLDATMKSLRGLVNAKLYGEDGEVKSPSSSKKSKHWMDDLSPQEKEFLAGLSPRELERLKSMENIE